MLFGTYLKKKFKKKFKLKKIKSIMEINPLKIETINFLNWFSNYNLVPIGMCLKLHLLGGDAISKFDDKENVAVSVAGADKLIAKNIPLVEKVSTVLSSDVFFKITFPLFADTNPVASHLRSIKVFTAICVALSAGVVDDKSTAYTCLGLNKITTKKINM